MREKLRELTKLTACVYPSLKLFMFVLEGFKSKNNCTRIKDVDLLGYMIDHYGIEVIVSVISLQVFSIQLVFMLNLCLLYSTRYVVQQRPYRLLQL